MLWQVVTSFWSDECTPCHKSNQERSLPPFTYLYEELRGVGESVFAVLNKSANLSNCPTKAQAITTLNPGF
ncbi:MAG: hypothetical protein KME25_21560 [Symplocastrum torsivum CPER-KK1]|uniref:Uncharacterized protein n=1 Tax=Symplocastrum torsivum CPER-KK1 TaxID=450513 RepID=A0A951UBL1_9CYAN|nr:hypothetical protein [Symplocastrum torsivum CPER-KK1]